MYTAPAIICACAIVAAPSVAAAQDAERPMEELNRAGFDAFERGDYAEAARIFNTAYGRYGDANLLKNEAIARYKGGDCEGATDAALRFLSEPRTNAPDREEMTVLVRRCEGDDGEGSEVTEDPAQGWTDTQVAGVSALGVGAAVLLGAGLYHAAAMSDSDELVRVSDQPGARARHAELTDSVNTARVVLPMLYGASAALLGVGTWLTLTPPEHEGAPPGVAVMMRF